MTDSDALRDELTRLEISAALLAALIAQALSGTALKHQDKLGKRYAPAA